MGFNLPRGNHYIAKMLLENFTDGQGYIHFLNKRKNKTYRTKPNNAFVETRRYIRYSEDGVQDNFEIEDVLSKIEGDAAPVLKIIIAAARELCLPGLFLNEQKAWKHFYFTSHMRTPKGASQILDEITSEEALSEALNSILDDVARSPLSRGIQDRSLLRRKLQRMVKHNVAADVAVARPLHIQEELRKHAAQVGLIIGVVHDLTTELIIGSCATAEVFPRSTTERIQGLWLPISYDVAISISDHPDGEHIWELTAMEVQQMNKATFQHSETIGARSAHLLEPYKQLG